LPIELASLHKNDSVVKEAAELLGLMGKPFKKSQCSNKKESSLTIGIETSIMDFHDFALEIA